MGRKDVGVDGWKAEPRVAARWGGRSKEATLDRPLDKFRLL